MTGTYAVIWSSNDPDRIAGALAELRMVLPPRPAVAAPDVEVLDAFDPVAPTEVVRDYIWVVGNYSPLVPELDAREVVRRWVGAVLLTGDGAAALQIALALGHEVLPPGAEVADALGWVERADLHSSRGRDGAELIARYLLDQPVSYRRAVTALTTWREHADLEEVLVRLWPYVAEPDRDRLGL